MPIQEKKYQTRHKYFALYHSGPREKTDEYAVKISLIEATMEQLKSYILNNELVEIRKLLNDDFVHPQRIRQEKTYSRHNERWVNNDLPPYNATRKLVSYQENTCYYDVHSVQPVLEVLVSQNYFKEIYELALQKNNGTLETILACMSNKSFIKANFSAFDLSGADLSGSDLSGAQFGVIDDANLTGATISESITKEQLYTVKTYEKATLPKDYCPFWTDETKILVKEKLNELLTSAVEYKNSDPHAHKKALELASSLKNMIDAPNAKYHEGFQRDFLNKINDYAPNFEHAPLLQAWVGSMVLFFVTLGVGYLAAFGVRAYNTGNYSPFFFNQTKIEQHVEAIKTIVNEPSLRV